MEPVFIAASAREADFVESVLEEEGIEFAQRLEPVPHETSGVCYQGVLFEVPGEHAAQSRRLLVERGLARGIVDGK